MTFKTQGRRRRLCVGDLVIVSRPYAKEQLMANLVRGFDTFPGDHGFHKSILVEPGLGVVLVKRDTFYKMWVHGREVWFEEHQISKVINR